MEKQRATKVYLRKALLLLSLLWVVSLPVQAHRDAQCYWAVIGNDIPQVRLLLDLGANPNMPDVMTRRHWGLHDEWEWWRDKLNGHVRHRPIDTKYTLLMRAVQYGDGPMVSLLIEHGADIDARDIMGRTALDWAIQNKREEAIQILRDSVSVKCP
jgi:ankyrin repeat protein